MIYEGRLNPVRENAASSTFRTLVSHIVDKGIFSETLAGYSRALSHQACLKLAENYTDASWAASERANPQSIISFVDTIFEAAVDKIDSVKSIAQKRDKLL